MIGNGTPARRPWWRWTSVPHTSLAIVSRIAPPGFARGSGCARTSRGRPGPVIQTDRTNLGASDHPHDRGRSRDLVSRHRLDAPSEAAAEELLRSRVEVDPVVRPRE